MALRRRTWASARLVAARQPLNESVKDLLGDVIKVSQTALNLDKLEPVEQWPEFLRESFIKECKPMHEIYERAVRANTRPDTGKNSV